MVNHDLVKYIHEYRKKGYPREHIIAHIVKHGHSHDEAHEAADHAEKYIQSGQELPAQSQAPTPQPSSSPQPQKKPAFDPKLNPQVHVGKPAKEHHHKEFKKGPVIMVGVAVLIVIVLFFVQESIDGEQPPAADDWYTPSASQGDLSLLSPVTIVGATDGMSSTCDDRVRIAFTAGNTFPESVNATLSVSSNESAIMQTWKLVPVGASLPLEVVVARAQVENKLVIVELVPPSGVTEESSENNILVYQAGVICEQ